MSMVSVERTQALSTDLLAGIRALLDRAFAGEFSDDDWEHAVGGWHVFVRDAHAVLAHAAVVPRLLHVDRRAFRTGYVEGVAVEPSRQEEGLGSQVMAEVNAVVKATFEFGALSTDRHSFYARLGWEAWRGPTFVRRDDDRIRTPDEDDGVMVLRFGQTVDVDLAGEITCEARPGDDW